MRYALRLLGAALLAALFVVPARAALPPPPAPQELPSSASGLVSDGRWLAWSYTYQPAGGAGPRRAIDVQEIASGQRTTLASDLPYGALLLSLGDGALAYAGQDAERRETTIVAQRLSGGARRELARGATVSSPAAFGNLAYWWEQPAPPANGRLYAASLSGGAAALLAEVDFTLYGFGGTRASAGWVAWAKGVGSSRASVCYELQAMSAAGGAVRSIADLGCGLPSFDLKGDRLAYIDREGLLVSLDLRSGVSVRSGPHCAGPAQPGAAADCGYLSGFSSDGRYAYWSRLAAAAPNNSYDLWGFDTATGSAFRVAAALPHDPGSGRPETSAAGGTLAWLAHPAAGATELRVIPIGASLPGAPEAPRPGARFFPETQHSLGGEFAVFWERNGGLPVFGYPLTGEFIQESRDDGEGYAVQYFERQRFEFHPENVGTPYVVLIGRMGAEALAAQGRDWAALPKASPATPHYFAATGQAVAPEFWAYWRSNGLELGDPGVSEREALALWGYPLTPAAVETLPDGSRRLVQWFERARFEYHPENPEPYKVLLGLLAADQVAGFGWR